MVFLRHAMSFSGVGRRPDNTTSIALYWSAQVKCQQYYGAYGPMKYQKEQVVALLFSYWWYLVTIAPRAMIIHSLSNQKDCLQLLKCHGR